MAPPFVMTTEQGVTDPVEEFNLPGERSATALAGSEGAMVAKVLRRVFDDPQFGLDTAQRELGRRLAASHMRLLGSSGVEPA